MKTLNPDIIFTKGYNPNTVFITEYRDLDGRLDPSFYEPLNISLIEEIKKMPHKKLYELASFSSESWNQKDIFENEFPYIEISEIDIPTGEILNVSYIPKAEAPSRAKKIVRVGDILVSTTRPSRGAICLINEKFDLHIASTGFEIIRDINVEHLDKEYLFNILRTRFCLMQMFYRSSGGNYPAITQEQLGKILIPVPSKVIQQKINSVFRTARNTYSNNKNKAKQIIQTIDNHLLKGLGITLPEEDNSIEKRIFTVEYKDVSKSKLDPYSNNPFYRKIEEAIDKSKYPKKRLFELINGVLVKGKLPTTEEKDGECNVVQINSINNNGSINLNELITSKNIFTKKQQLQKDDIIIAITGATIGKTAIWDYEGVYYLGGDLIKFQASKEIIAIFLYSYLRSIPAQLEIKRCITGATNGHLSPDDVANIIIPLPPLEKQQEIATTISNLLSDAKNNITESETLNSNLMNEIETILKS